MNRKGKGVRVAICSDLHLEFGDLHLENTEGADVLILGGDILIAKDLECLDPIMRDTIRGAHAKMYFEFIRRCCEEFKTVLYIAGNHEHYHGDFADTFNLLRKYLPFNNLHILDKESIRIDDVIFFCGTLWTDMNKEEPSTMRAIAHMMNDFRLVENSNRMVSYKVPVLDDDDKLLDGFKMEERPGVFSPQDSVDDHKMFLVKLTNCLVNNPTNKFVVVGHHAPSKISTHPRYKNETLMNGAYSSDLTEFMLNNPNIKLWTHGHTHDEFDYMIGSCRVVCNPRGYDGYEDRADNFKLKYVEID